MLKVSGKIAKLKFDHKGYKGETVKISKLAQREAVAAWVRAVAGSTPVYTGTALGTIAPVGRTVGEILAPVSNNTSKKFFHYNGRKYPLGFGAGEDYQEHSLQTEASSQIVISTFTFNENLPYVVWNSLYPISMKGLKNKTPWYSLQKGVAAYVQYIRENLPEKLPKHAQFLRIKIVKVV